MSTWFWKASRPTAYAIPYLNFLCATDNDKIIKWLFTLRIKSRGSVFKGRKLSPPTSVTKITSTWLRILNTLFNIVKAQFKTIVELWRLCCIMIFRWINKQPGIQKFWHFCSHYQDIYITEYHHWINGQAHHLF